MATSPARLQQLLTLAQEPSAEKRRALLEELTDLFLDTSDSQNQSEHGLFGDVLQRVAYDVESEARRHLADRLAAEPNAPAELIQQLAHDTIDIATPVLERSSVLNDQDLVDIVRQKGQQYLLAVSKRSDVSENVSDALIERGDEDVLVSLIKNDNAQISRDGAERLVEMSETVEALQAPLVHRQDVPADLVNQMYFWVSSSLREHILSRSDMDETVLDQVLRDTRTAVLSGIEERSKELDDAQTIVARQKKRGQLNEQFMIRALRQGLQQVFMLSFSEIVGVNYKTTQRILGDASREALAIASKASRLDRSTFSTIVLLTNKGTPSHSGDVAELLSVYDQIPIDVANRTMRFWRVRQSSRRLQSDRQDAAVA